MSEEAHDNKRQLRQTIHANERNKAMTKGTKSQTKFKNITKKKSPKNYKTRFTKELGVSESDYAWSVALIYPTAKDQTLRQKLFNDTELPKDSC